MVQENNYSDFVERFLLHEGREFTFSLLLVMKGGLLKLLLDAWVGRVGMPSRSFSTYHS